MLKKKKRPFHNINHMLEGKPFPSATTFFSNFFVATVTSPALGGDDTTAFLKRSEYLTCTYSCDRKRWSVLSMDILWPFKNQPLLSYSVIFIFYYSKTDVLSCVINHVIHRRGYSCWQKINNCQVSTYRITLYLLSRFRNGK